MLGMNEDVLRSKFEPRSSALSPAARSMVVIPEFVSSLTADGRAVLVQATVLGASAFLATAGMDSGFATAAEAEAVHASVSSQPDGVLGRLVSARDRPATLRAFASLLYCSKVTVVPGTTEQPRASFQSAASCLARVWAKQTSPVRSEVLCLIEMRIVVSEDGGSAIFGLRLTPKSMGSPAPVPMPRTLGAAAGAGGGAAASEATSGIDFLLMVALGTGSALKSLNKKRGRDDHEQVTSTAGEFT